MHGGRFVTLRAERRSAPCCAVDSREVSSRQPVGEWRLAGKVSGNTFGVIFNTPGLFFNKVRFSENKAALLKN